jgi:hypothetical protein
MPTDPHSPEPRDEARITMLAAETAISKLQEEVADAKEAARWRKIQVRILAAVVAALVVGAGVLAYSVNATRDQNSQIHQNAVQSCRDGNSYRAEQTMIWDGFIDLLLQGNNNPADHEKGKEFKAFVAKVNAPRNCEKINSLTAAESR